MTLFGIALRRPTFAQFTSATVLGVGLWMLLLGVMARLGIETTAVEAGGALVVVAWSCIAVQLGIHVGQGLRHLLANLAVGSVLLLAWQAAALAFSG
jgi:hypothetical protein